MYKCSSSSSNFGLSGSHLGVELLGHVVAQWVTFEDYPGGSAPQQQGPAGPFLRSYRFLLDGRGNRLRAEIKHLAPSLPAGGQAEVCTRLLESEPKYFAL